MENLLIQRHIYKKKKKTTTLLVCYVYTSYKYKFLRTKSFSSRTMFTVKCVEWCMGFSKYLEMLCKHQQRTISLVRNITFFARVLRGIYYSVRCEKFNEILYGTKSSCIVYRAFRCRRRWLFKTIIAIKKCQRNRKKTQYAFFYTRFRLVNCCVNQYSTEMPKHESCQ